MRLADRPKFYSSPFINLSPILEAINIQDSCYLKELKLIAYVTSFVSGLFKARMSEEDDNVCNLFLADNYIVKDKDYGNIGLDYEKSKSFKVQTHSY